MEKLQVLPCSLHGFFSKSSESVHPARARGMGSLSCVLAFPNLRECHPVLRLSLSLSRSLSLSLPLSLSCALALSPCTLTPPLSRSLPLFTLLQREYQYPHARCLRAHPPPCSPATDCLQSPLLQKCWRGWVIIGSIAPHSFVVFPKLQSGYPRVLGYHAYSITPRVELPALPGLPRGGWHSYCGNTGVYLCG